MSGRRSTKNNAGTPSKKAKSDPPLDENKLVKKAIKLGFPAEIAKETKKELLLEFVGRREAERREAERKLKAERSAREKATREAREANIKLIALKKQRDWENNLPDTYVLLTKPASALKPSDVRPLRESTGVGSHAAFLWASRMIHDTDFRYQELQTLFTTEQIESFTKLSQDFIENWNSLLNSLKKHDNVKLGLFAVEMNERRLTSLLAHEFSVFVDSWPVDGEEGWCGAFHEMPVVPKKSKWDPEPSQSKSSTKKSNSKSISQNKSDTSAETERKAKGEGYLDLSILYFPDHNSLYCTVPLFIEVGLGGDKAPQTFGYATYLDRMYRRTDEKIYKEDPYYRRPRAFLGVALTVKETVSFDVYGYCAGMRKKVPMKMSECLLYSGKSLNKLEVVLQMVWAFRRIQENDDMVGWVDVDNPGISVRQVKNRGKYVFKTYGSLDSPTNRSIQESMKNIPGASIINVSKSIKVLQYPYIEGTHQASCPSHFVDIIKTLAAYHKIGYVHGDIRRYNMIFAARKKSYLIDFDFAGKEGVDQYPQGYLEVKDTKRHEDAKSCRVLKKDHDIFSLKYVMSLYSFGNDSWTNLWLRTVSGASSLKDLEAAISKLSFKDKNFKPLEDQDLEVTGTGGTPPKARTKRSNENNLKGRQKKKRREI